jgi:hypothetical protein
MPKPPIPSWSSPFPEWHRPSLLDPPETDGRRRGTINGAQPFKIPEDGEQSPGTIGGAMQSVVPEEEESSDDGVGTGGATTAPNTPDG